MKAYLEFDMEDQFDREKLILAQKASDLNLALDEIYEKIFRHYRKYEDLSEEQSKLLEKLSDQFFEILSSYDIKL